MNNITKIKPFTDSGALVEYATDLLDEDKITSAAFIGYGDTIAEILGVILNRYTTDIECIQMDEFTYNDLYRLVIDEDFIISVVPIRKDNGEYIITNVNMQFISDEVPARYVKAVDDKGYKYQVFTLDSDFEEETDEIERDIETDTEIAEENSGDSSFEIPVSVKFEVSLNGRPYDKLSDDEKQIFDIMFDWGFFW